MDALSVSLIIGWASHAQRALLDYARCFRAIISGEDRLPAQVEFVIRQLQLRAADTSDSALYLIGNLKLWDAEILVRTVMESSIKLTYICAGESGERDERSDEFLLILPDIARMKRHARAEDLLLRLERTGEVDVHPITDVLIRPEELEALKARYPKDRRARVEGKWGFIRIGEALGAASPEFKELAGLAYQYGMGSHSVHQDGDAIRMMWDREQRDEDRRSAMELSHAARLISDILSYALLRARAAYRAVDLELVPVHEVDLRYKFLRDELDDAYRTFHVVEYPETGGEVEDLPAFKGLEPEGQPFVRRREP